MTANKNAKISPQSKKKKNKQPPKNTNREKKGQLNHVNDDNQAWGGAKMQKMHVNRYNKLDNANKMRTYRMRTYSQ